MLLPVSGLFCDASWGWGEALWVRKLHFLSKEKDSRYCFCKANCSVRSDAADIKVIVPETPAKEKDKASDSHVKMPLITLTRLPLPDTPAVKPLRAVKVQEFIFITVRSLRAFISVLSSLSASLALNKTNGWDWGFALGERAVTAHSQAQMLFYSL